MWVFCLASCLFSVSLFCGSLGLRNNLRRYSRRRKKMSRWRPVEWNIFFRNLPFSLVTCTLFFLRLCLISFSHFFVLCFFGVHFARLAGPTTTTTGGWSNISDRQSFANTKKTCCGVSLPAFFCSLVAKGFTEKISSNCVLLPFSVCRRLSN